MNKGFFIASTGQNIGKTTLSLGLLSGLQKMGCSVTYMKPVGQELGKTESGIIVDKDAVLVKELFNLPDDPRNMSPILVTPGFTKDFLDGKIQAKELLSMLLNAYKKLTKPNTFFLAEGTGHVGVGSIVHLNNAQVAKQLNLPIILIASGGLGSAFDELTLNKTICDLYGVRVLGVILNRVREEKKEMITFYIEKALKRWNIPLLGCIPYSPLLSRPSVRDLEDLLDGSFLSGKELKLTQYEEVHLVTSESFQSNLKPNQLIITSTTREDLLLEILEKHKQSPLPLVLVLSGEIPPKESLIEKLQNAKLPVLYTKKQSDETLELLHFFTAKIKREDAEKIALASDLVEKNINFPLLLRLL